MDLKLGVYKRSGYNRFKTTNCFKTANRTTANRLGGQRLYIYNNNWDRASFWALLNAQNDALLDNVYKHLFLLAFRVSLHSSFPHLAAARPSASSLSSAVPLRSVRALSRLRHRYFVVCKHLYSFSHFLSLYLEK